MHRKILFFYNLYGLCKFVTGDLGLVSDGDDVLSFIEYEKERCSLRIGLESDKFCIRTLVDNGDTKLSASCLASINAYLYNLIASAFLKQAKDFAFVFPSSN